MAISTARQPKLINGKEAKAKREVFQLVSLEENLPQLPVHIQPCNKSKGRLGYLPICILYCGEVEQFVSAAV